MSEGRQKQDHSDQSAQQFGSGAVLYHGRSFDTESSNSVQSLLRPPIVRQWIHQGNIHREHAERVPSRLELFFDLVFVAIANQMSHAVAESASGAGVVKFILIFYPTWSLWSEFRNFINASGTDDVLQRLAVLWLMGLLIGYTANASAIKLGSPTSTEASVDLMNSTIGGILAEVGQSSGSEAAAGTHARDPALVAAVAFFLVGKFSRVLVLAWYAVALPLFRTYFSLQVLYQMLNFFVYFPILFVRAPWAIITLATLGLITDYFPRYLSRMPTHMMQAYKSGPSQPQDVEMSQRNTRSKPYGRLGRATSIHIPATNIEHFVERTSAFVVIVLGEIVLSVVYIASQSQTGVSRVYGTALCAVLVAFNFCWLYFDAECSREFVHAMHRHWFTSVTYTNLHFPLCASLIIVAAATYKMTQHPEKVTKAIGWYFSGGLGVALVALALIGFTHRGLDPKGTTRLGRFTQLGCRIGVGVIVFCLPLTTDVTATFMLGNSAGLTTFLVIEETYGKLRRGEPIAKPDATQLDVLDARISATQGGVSRMDSNGDASSGASIGRETRVQPGFA